MKSEVRAVYDNRVAYLYTSNLDMPSRLTLARELGTLERVSMTALKRENGIDLFTAAKRQARIDYAVAPCPSGLAARFRWIDEKVENSFHCIEDYDKVSSVKNDSFVVSALVEFFVSRHAPDIVVLPDGNSDFTGIYGGNHGGLTPEEILVPFLSREVEMPPGIFPSHKTLEIMGLKNTKN